MGVGYDPLGISHVGIFAKRFRVSALRVLLEARVCGFGFRV